MDANSTEITAVAGNKFKHTLRQLWRVLTHNRWEVIFGWITFLALVVGWLGFRPAGGSSRENDSRKIDEPDYYYSVSDDDVLLTGWRLEHVSRNIEIVLELNSTKALIKPQWLGMPFYLVLGDHRRFVIPTLEPGHHHLHDLMPDTSLFDRKSLFGREVSSTRPSAPATQKN